MIEATIEGDGAVVARLRNFSVRLGVELIEGIGRLTLMLQRDVMANKLSGQVLKVRTGRLRRSIQQDVRMEGGQVVGTVSTPVKYAPPHEYGFAGTVTVKEHLRMQTKAWGRSIEPRQVTVRAHSAKANLPERSFLRSALRELQASGKITEEINAAITRAGAA